MSIVICHEDQFEKFLSKNARVIIKKETAKLGDTTVIVGIPLQLMARKYFYSAKILAFSPVSFQYLNFALCK
jgi:hypothetical protein